jgi:polysaccharide biosynthesis/export protein
MISIASARPAGSPASRFRHSGVGQALLVLFAAVSLAGCATSKDQLGGDPGLRVLQAKEMPFPDRVDMTANSRPYFVGPFDKISIDVYGIEELSKREVQVDAAGKISFPLAGIVEVSGRTPGEIERIMAERLRANFVRNPQVIVNMKEMVSQLITIEGQVGRPGRYPVVGQMSLLQAMALSGGTSEFAKLDDVIVFRTVRGERLAALYNLKAIRLGQYADPEVFANDIVSVGDNKARRRFRDFLQVMPALTTPLFFIIDRVVK